MKEEWKDIKGYEGYYQVSNLGNIKSFIYFNGHEYIYRERILKPQNNRYLIVRLAKNKKVKQYTIHRLVAEYFISNEDKKPYDLNGNFIKEYKSISEASKTNNIPTSNISNCCKKNVHTAGGYIWKYAR